MMKIIIAIKKYLFVKPKWRFLRVITKVIKRSQIERIRKSLEEDIRQETDENKKSFLMGQLEVINFLLDKK